MGTSQQVIPQLVAKNKVVYNETVALANVEQSLVLGDVYGYIIKVREYDAELKLSHVSGESGTKFLTIPLNAVHMDDNYYEGLTIYFQCTVAPSVVEVVAWEKA